MDDNGDFNFNLEFLNQLTDPVENNLSNIFNLNNTDTTPISNTSLFPPTPINIPINPVTNNMAPAMMPAAPIPIPTPYSATYYNDSFPQTQNPAMWSSPTVEEPLEPNWEAINAYLRGQVRPGADVEHVYRCNVCGAEFANAQALGGHKGMHRKNKTYWDAGTSSKTGQSKKPRRR